MEDQVLGMYINSPFLLETPMWAMVHRGLILTPSQLGQFQTTSAHVQRSSYYGVLEFWTQDQYA